MKITDIAIIGGGPAGLSAAIYAASLGAKVTLIDDGLELGGQLIKQTHKFFGSEKQFAGIRGIEIAEKMIQDIKEYDNITVIANATVTGYYEDEAITIVQGVNGELLKKLKANRIIIATGASENMLPFVNNDLPGVYGAGAVQTLMNLYGVVPGNNILMVGAGNIGLIVSYQLLQAGIKVSAIVEALPKIGGYLVHASKIRRLGIPIYTSHTLKEVYGTDCVERAVISEINRNFEFIPGTEKELEVDTICLAVGLSPLSDLLWQAGCQMKYVTELCGYVALRDDNMKTTKDKIYIAGDVAGIEEASSAMLEGQIAGLNTAVSLGYKCDNYPEQDRKLKAELKELRDNPLSKEIKRGIEKALIKEGRD
ncbi:MAG: FAD-dependent oxidoreductase [Candidatus Atribacteria bacterium]|nr:FAD-dependent oxidoreductase [Candidatus Atribacteria bacterium]MBE3127790.1 FAD-dependent oxidoreductase [Candidatus Atribacteria bacterium]